MMRSLTTRFARKLFSRSKKPSRTPTFRPQLESLEDRRVASASSVNVHAVAEPSGASVAYFINPDTNTGKEFWEKTDHGRGQEIAGSGEVSDFSAGLNRSGNAVVFAHLNGTFEYFTDATGWQNTQAPIGILNFAAVDGGRLYAVGANHALWQYTIPYTETWRIVFGGHVSTVTVTLGGWQELTGPNAVYSVDAVTQTSGSDVVFAEGFYGNGPTNQLEVYSKGTWKYIGGGGDVQLGFSAGLDSQGNAEVWYQETENISGFLGIGGIHTYGFYSWTAATGSQTYLYLNNDAPRYAPTLTATGDGQCYFFQPDFKSPSSVVGGVAGSGALKLYDPQTTDTVVVQGLDKNTQVSAAGPGDVYFISASGELAEATINANGTLVNTNLWLGDGGQTYYRHI
jgi:hypothetical protein